MVDVAGSILSAFLQVLFDRIATQRLLEFFRGKNIDEAMLDDLNTQLLSVNALLEDAEEKQFANPSVKKWVDKLREAVYDADDVLDHIATRAFQSKVSYSLLSLNPFSESMKSKLEGINSRLKSIADKRDLLGLEGGGKISSLSMPTTCLINEREVYGRDAVKNYIVDLIERSEDLSVIAIVGMAGMGKTTLSQIVYQDRRVGDRFNMRSWVYISDGSNVFEVTKKIYDSLTGSSSKIRDLNTLQMKLESELRGKRFLLVLDDYWAEDFLDWDLLHRPLRSGLPGSSILVTTRNESVALTMHATNIYRLPPLSDEDSWSLFARHAFLDPLDEYNPTIREFGEQIVKKCKGHPLAVKTFGSLLTSKTEAQDWKNIMQSNVWDLPVHKSNILPALRLSYRRLPGHLKQCFAYYSIFPKGYVGNKRNLFHLWMAEGFLPLPKNEETIEDVGEKYLRELSLRSFLQSNDSSFTMHDLMIDLAQHIGGEFFCKLERNDPRQDPKKVRHLSFFLDEVDGIEKFEAFFNLSPLRTFLSLRSTNSGRSRSIEGYLNLLLCERRCLRVLSLSNYPITCLPESIIHLEHLRYLNLSHTLIKQLPESVGSLYNLQTLLLSNCGLLTVLPTSMQNLINLHHLDISGTTLSEMPPQFGKLEHLQLLTTFVVSRKGSKISQLGALLKLSGALSIENLQNVNPEDASGAKIKEKEFLDDLELKWPDGIHNWMVEAEVLYNLQPHTRLKSLKIENFGGKIFPDWLGSSSFFNMVSVHLVSCKNCLSLPPLGQLPSLKTLHIENMTSIKVVDPTFFGNSTRPFSSLKNLTFVNMSEWLRWQLDGREFLYLEVFHLRECPRLGGSLPWTPSLRELELDGCNALVSLPEEMFRGNDSLRKVVLKGCHNLELLPGQGFPNSLDSLSIDDCPRFFPP